MRDYTSIAGRFPAADGSGLCITKGVKEIRPLAVYTTTRVIEAETRGIPFGSEALQYLSDS